MSRRLKKNPYQVKNVKVVPVVEVEGDRSLYFAKFGYLQPAVQPQNLQELERKQQRITGLLFTAADALAEKEGVTSDEARQRFVPTKTADGQVVEPVNFLDYLTPSERAEIIGLQQESKDLPYLVATLFTKYRLAYEIKVLEPEGEANGLRQPRLRITEPWFSLNAGDRFMFEDGTIIEISSGYAPETGLVGTRPLMRDFLASETGFLLKAGSSDYAIGDPSWSLEDTQQMMGLTHIEAIYRFYKEESGESAESVELMSEEVAESDEGKMLEPSQSLSNDTPNPNRSNGKKSGSASSTLVAATPE